MSPEYRLHSIILAQLAFSVGIRLLVALLRRGTLLSPSRSLPARFRRLGTVGFAGQLGFGGGRLGGLGFGLGGALVGLGPLEDDVDADLRDSATRPPLIHSTHRHRQLLLLGLADADLGVAACSPPDGAGFVSALIN
jgi:hypothetical protein